MNDLVIMRDKQAVTSSLNVAETFEKQHKHVIEAIENKIHSAENSAQYQKMFVEGSYKDKSGKSNHYPKHVNHQLIIYLAAHHIYLHHGGDH